MFSENYFNITYSLKNNFKFKIVICSNNSFLQFILILNSIDQITSIKIHYLSNNK